MTASARIDKGRRFRLSEVRHSKTPPPEDPEKGILWFVSIHESPLHHSEKVDEQHNSC